MNIPKVIGIVRDYKNTIISNLVFLLLKQNGHNVILINNVFIKTNEHIIEYKTINDEIIKNNLRDKNNIDYIILDNLQIEQLSYFIEKIKIDVLIDDGVGDEDQRYKESCDVKRSLLTNLKRNGICIINSDNKLPDNYFDRLQDKIIITYGLETKSTITASSLDIDETVSFNCCIQRGLTTLEGNEIEQMEFPIKVKYYDEFNISDFLALIGLALIYEISVDSLRQILYEIIT